LCGILGIWPATRTGEEEFKNIPAALARLSPRGPDFADYKIHSNVALGHTRLSIIDLSEKSNQPFSDESGRYHLVFNGEIYNYTLLKSELEKSGLVFRTASDTEVLLHLLIQKGQKALDELQGFFAFLFFDSVKNELLAVRDRFGIKPLVYYEDQDKLIFASDLSAIMAFNIDKTLDAEALNAYFSYTYVPAPFTVLKNARKLEPGTYLKITKDSKRFVKYYATGEKPAYTSDFETAKTELHERLQRAVQRRLVADVPLGSFLSGGLDSSIIALLAKHQKEDLQTFSIGFDHPYFDESRYALEIAQHIGTRHEQIILSKPEFRAHFQQFLDCLDEPFADSSAFAVYLLSKKTKEHVTVSLSGDGADEVFGGYRKHLAEMKTRAMGKWRGFSLGLAVKVLTPVGTSRSNRLGDLNRKVQKLAGGFRMSSTERYDHWCRWIPDAERLGLLTESWHSNVPPTGSGEIADMNDFLLRDQQFVLPNDMLKKVDMASMAHGLEVRVPFLDHELVEFANSLPHHFKVTQSATKRILRETYKPYLPGSIIDRSKKGFEIPLEEWLGDLISDQFESRIFSEAYLREQGIFNPAYITRLRKMWIEKNPGEHIYTSWALLVFQHWYDKNFHS
jgi:asparagine synthase (glutamine-hydrolysing)